MKRKLFGTIGLLYSTLTWGSMYFIIKASLGSINPIALMADKFLLASVGLFLFVILTKRPIIQYWKHCFFLGFILWAIYIPQTLGLQYISASSSAFLTGMFVVFTPILFFIFCKKKPNYAQILAIALSVEGLWILTNGINTINIGDVLTLVTAFMNAIYIVYIDFLNRKKIDPITMTYQACYSAWLLSFITCIFLGSNITITSTKSIYIILYLAFIPTISAYIIQIYAQKEVDPLFATLIMSLEPAFGAMFAWTIGGEQFVTTSVIGGLLICIGVIISNIRVKSMQSNI